jgi:AraC-like DNA-binding protein
VARFREHIGLPPKTVARVLRFEQAVRLAEETELSWLEIALRCGYYDQAHLIRDFRAISGCTPGTFFQDVGAPAA